MHAFKNTLSNVKNGYPRLSKWAVVPVTVCRPSVSTEEGTSRTTSTTTCQVLPLTRWSLYCLGVYTLNLSYCTKRMQCIGGMLHYYSSLQALVLKPKNYPPYIFFFKHAWLFTPVSLNKWNIGATIERNLTSKWQDV